MAIREMLIGCIGVEHGDQLLAEDLGVKANTRQLFPACPFHVRALWVKKTQRKWKWR
jgi:hypothetical protein